MKKVYLAPSILSADLLLLQEQIQLVEKNGADFIHVDIMDGHFVPNITFGPVIVSVLKRVTKLPLDVHLMISDPDKYTEHFATAGANYLTVHAEGNFHLHRTIQNIKSYGVKVGLALNPATPLYPIEPMLGEIDLVLAMTVNPGFGGQKFIDLVLNKISDLAEIKRKNNLKFLIEVDGGINTETAATVVEAGAEVLVAGDAVFGQQDIAASCRILKKVAEDSLGKK
jgi:ribulose-phosphate 3-epimerase